MQAPPILRHPATVRITHWVNSLSFLGLIVSGVAILLAHPRFYWGETGNLNMPSLFDMPLPLTLNGQNGWGRYLHFSSAWITVLNGIVYVATGLLTRHFGGAGGFAGYEPLQRLTYRAVVFGLFPLVIWTGLAMSPALVSVWPGLVTTLGGHQSARTLHFLASSLAVLFLLAHLAMVALAGFRSHVLAMITGTDAVTGKETA